MGTAELIKKQGEIIRLQSEIIDRLFLTSLQHMEIDDLENNGCLKLIKKASEEKENAT